MATERTVWHEVLDTRREWNKEIGGELSMEVWRPDELDRWMEMLNTTVDLIPMRSTPDPRQACIDVMAVASAWVDAMDQRPGVGT